MLEQEKEKTEQQNVMIDQQNATIEMEKAKTEQEKAKTEQRSLVMLIKQPITFVNRTASGSYIGRNTHKPVKTVKTSVELQKIDVPEEVLNSGYLRRKQLEISIHSEAMVVAEAVKIIEAVLNGLKISDSVHVAANRIICGVECDIVLLLGSQQIPFAAIEVKKPGCSKDSAQAIFSSEDEEGVSDAGIVAGQNSDQLAALECMGYRSLFGMITDGNGWMITCHGNRDFVLPEQNWWAQLRSDPMETGNSPEQDATNIEHFQTTFKDLKNKSEHKKKASRKQKTKLKKEYKEGNGKGVKQAGSLKEPESDDDTGDGTLTVSQLVLSTNGEDLIKLIITFICLAGVPLLDKKSQPILSRMSCRVLNLKINSDPQKQKGGDMRCSFEKHSFSRGIDLSTYLDYKKSVEIYLCFHLGSGWCGDCCLAATKDGTQCCAVKFFIKPEDTALTGHKLAEMESENWGKVYKSVKCYVGELPSSGGYLCMPYLRPILPSDRQTLLNNKKVEKALKQFASSGYIHDDVFWRHLGFRNGELCLCDLGSISQVTKEGAKLWIDKTLSKLQDRVKMQSSTPVAGSTPMHDSGFNLQNNTVHSETTNSEERKHLISVHSSMDMADGSNEAKKTRLK
jgi:hypothetical protein